MNYCAAMYKVQYIDVVSWVVTTNHEPFGRLAKSSPSADLITQLEMEASKWPAPQNSYQSPPQYHHHDGGGFFEGRACLTELI